MNNGYNNTFMKNPYNQKYSNNLQQGTNVFQFNNQGNQYQQTGVGMKNNNPSNNNLSREENVV